MLELEQVKGFLGFGDGDNPGEYYFSRGMRSVRGGIQPGWRILERARSSTVASLDLINEFAERLETDPQIYGVDDGGEIFKVQDGLSNWALDHTSSVTTDGQGVIVGHSSSQRLLYPQRRYLGSYDGTVWYDTFQDFGTPTQTTHRASDIYEDWVLFGNGSTVALLNITDDSWNAAAFTMPGDFNVADIKAGRNGVLIGANFNNRGVLMLWDVGADRAIAPWIWTEGKIYGIAKFDGIWVVSLGRKLILTNGYSISRVYNTPDLADTGHNFGPRIVTGMIIDGNYLIMGSSTVTGYNRQKRGFYILNLITGLWEFCPLSTFNTYTNSTTGAVFISSNRRRHVSYGDTALSPNQEYIGQLLQASSPSYFITEAFGEGSPYKKTAEGIFINLHFARDEYDTYTNPNWAIDVKLYNFRRQLWGWGQTKTASTSKDELTVDATVSGYNVAEIGDEITILEGLNAGEIRHIASMTGAGTATEVWTMDSDFSNLTETTKRIGIMPFQKVGSKTITSDEMKDERLYIPVKKSIVGRKFLVKVFVKSMDYMNPHITGVTLVYNRRTI